jgi:hypothetical protein
MSCTIKSRTSGTQLKAEVIKESKIREFFGLPCVNLMVIGSNLKGVCIRNGWYHRNEITES